MLDRDVHAMRVWPQMFVLIVVWLLKEMQEAVFLREQHTPNMRKARDDTCSYQAKSILCRSKSRKPTAHPCWEDAWLLGQVSGLT